MTPDGRRVNYRAMALDPGFRAFTTAAAELQAVDPAPLSREEALCFWINLYNCAIVHATAAAGPARTTLERLRWFDAAAYLVGGRRFSCNDIEHGVLRGNAPSPASPLSLMGLGRWAPPTFPAGDPRARLAMTPVDPRIHFALNCGANSCPPIRVYVPGRLEVGLEGAAAAFCGGEVAVDVAARTLTLSSIFKWYGGDFGTKAELIRFLESHVQDGGCLGRWPLSCRVQRGMNYLPLTPPPPLFFCSTAGTRAQLQAVLNAAGGAEGVKLQYKPYDWTSNATE